MAAPAAPRAAARASPNPGVEAGDHVYVQHPKHGPMAVKVLATGRDGFTAEGADDGRHRVPYDRVLGHRKRVAATWREEDRGEDGSIVRDHTGRRRFVAGELPRPEPAPRDEPRQQPQEQQQQQQQQDDPLLDGLDRLTKALAVATDVAAHDVLRQLFLKGPTSDGDISSKAGRDALGEAGLVARHDGFAFLTEAGIEAAIAAGFDREKEHEMRKGLLLFMKASQPSKDSGRPQRPQKTQDPAGGRKPGTAAAGGSRDRPPAASMKHGDIVLFRHGKVEGKGKLVGSGTDGVTVRDDAGREHQIRHDALVGPDRAARKKKAAAEPMEKAILLFSAAG